MLPLQPKYSRIGWAIMRPDIPPVSTLLDTLRTGLSECLADAEDEPLMVGIHSGGHWVAQRLHAALGLSTPLGAIDISFYRDDFSRIGLHPQVKPSTLPMNPDGRTVVLVDDVLYTGRTVRAALNELFDFGRPARIILAVLVDRGGRELPITADVAGMRITPEQSSWQIKLSGPDPLAFQVVDAEDSA